MQEYFVFAHKKSPAFLLFLNIQVNKDLLLQLEFKE